MAASDSTGLPSMLSLVPGDNGAGLRMSVGASEMGVLLALALGNDGIAPLRNSEALASQIRRARLAVFNGGHGFLWEDPVAWPLLLAFLTAEGF